MKIQIYAIFFLFLVSIGVGGDFKIIVNKEGPLQKLSAKDLERIYSGRKNTEKGIKIVPINQALDAELAAGFLKKIAGQTPAEYKEYWVAQQVKGKGSAPMIQKTDEAVIAIVSQIPGAVGYISADKSPENVTVVQLPGIK